MSEWQPIETIPIGKAVIVADARDGIAKWAVAEREADGGILISAPGLPVTSSKWWTHWMPIPAPPGTALDRLATARNDALEEAAKAAEKCSFWSDPPPGKRIAVAIRALKSETPS